MNSFPLRAARFACIFSPLLCATSAAQGLEYLEIDNVEGSQVQLNAAPVRPMALDANNDLWAVNTSDSTIERFILDGPKVSSAPSEVVPVPWGPVSIALWTNGAGDEELLVVCRNTHGLLRLDRATGAYLEMIPLDTEPSDIVVDAAAGLAFVSCMGADSVWQVDLLNDSHVHEPFVTARDRRYHRDTHPAFAMKSPYFLALGPTGVLRVSPLHSGNNTTADGPSTSINGSQEVIELTSGVPLPDEDLFLIDPAAGPTGVVTAAGRGIGTILFAHGLNPADGAHWHLHTESHNTLAQNEHDLNGVFASNRMLRSADLALPAPVSPITPAPADFIALDAHLSATLSAPLAQPFALGFSPSGEAFVAGMGSDNVAMFSPLGDLVREWELPSGSIPRGLLHAVIDDGTAPAEYVLVYAYGTGRIHIHDFSLTDPATTGQPVLQLANDPTPELISLGRQLFFDAGNSLHGNLSCATCHVDAGTDFLVWNLSSGPGPDAAGTAHSVDHKGPMVTQTLVGLERLAPFHWRGEKDELEDFNGAFVGLLGGPSVLSPTDFSAFQAFLFALANPANPNQHRDRRIDETRPFPRADLSVLGAADTWQDQFLTNEVFQGRFACVHCHDTPTGTNNGIVADAVGSNFPERAFFKPAPFHETWRKEQPIVTVEFEGRTDERALLGAGPGHAGTTPDILDFTEAVVPVPGYLDDTVSFVHQWDQGLAPAVHGSFLLTPDVPVARIQTELVDYLFEQAKEGNCDLVAFGVTEVAGVPRTVRWYMATEAGNRFIADDPSIPNRRLTQFLNQSQALLSNENVLFVGVPVGMGERFAIDYDFDGTRNVPDAAPYDSDGFGGDAVAPVIDSPLALRWMTTKAARLTVTSNEPTTAVLRYRKTSTPLALFQTTKKTIPSKVHAFMVTDLESSTLSDYVASPTAEFGIVDEEYEFFVDLQDLNGNELVGTVPVTGTTDEFVAPDDLVLGALSEADRLQLEAHVVAEAPQVTAQVGARGGFDVTVDLSTDFKMGGGVPATDRIFVLRVWRRVSGSDELEQLESPTDGRVLSGGLLALSAALEPPAGPLEPLNVAGPLLVTTELTQGTRGVASTSVTVTVADGWVNSGDEVVVTVEAVVEVPDDRQGAFAANVLNCGGGTGPCDFSIPVNSRNAWSQWDFPTTREDRFIGSAVLP